MASAAKAQAAPEHARRVSGTRSAAHMERGTVKMFSVTRGFGFITPDDGSPDIFVHVNSLKMSGIPSVSAGDRVEYERVQDNKGWQAYRVALV